MPLGSCELSLGCHCHHPPPVSQWPRNYRDLSQKHGEEVKGAGELPPDPPGLGNEALNRARSAEDGERGTFPCVNVV